MYDNSPKMSPGHPVKQSLSHGESLRPFWLALVLGSAPLGVFEFLLPMYGRALGASLTAVGGAFSVFSITAIATRLVLQYGLDRWPRERVFQAGLLGYVVAMLGFVLAAGLRDIALARLVQGVASAATWLSASVLLASWAPGNERGATFGRSQMLGTWGAGLGATWALGAIALLEAQARSEVEQVLAVVGGALGLQLTPFPWPTPPLAELDVLRLIFGGYALGCGLALLAALRIPRQLRAVAQAQAAMPSIQRIDLGALRAALHAAPGARLLLVGLLRGAALSLTLPVLIIYLDERFGAGLAGIVLASAVPGAVYATAPQPLGRFADYLGYTRAVLLATLVSAATYAGLPLAPSLWLVALLWVAEALSFSLAGPALAALTADAGGEQRLGGAFARYSLAAVVGGALTPPLGGWLYEHVAPAAPFYACAALLLLSLLPLVQGVGHGLKHGARVGNDRSRTT
jgi:MFS family permease